MQETESFMLPRNTRIKEKLGLRAFLPASCSSLPASSRNRGYLLLLAPVLAYLVLFFVYPLARTLLQSLFDPRFTISRYADLFKYPVYLRVIWNTIRISFTATLACVALGYPVAWCLSGPESNWTRALLFAVLLPFWISILIRTFAWMVILGREGIVNQLLLRAGLIAKPLHLIYNRFGVCVGLVYVLLPYAILPMLSVMRSIDRTLLRAAESLGSSPWQTFSRIFLPLSLPGVWAGALLTFILGVGAFITPVLMGGAHETMVAMCIESQLDLANSWGFAGVLSVVLLAIVLTLFYLFSRVLGVGVFLGGLSGNESAPGFQRKKKAENLKGSFAAGRLLSRMERFCESCAERIERMRCFLACAIPEPIRRIDWKRYGLIGFCCFVFCFLILPVFVIIPVAFSNDPLMHFPPHTWGLGLFRQFFDSGKWTEATGNSFRIAIAVMLLATALGTPAAYSLARGKFRCRAGLLAFLVSPLIIPAIVSAISIYFLFARLELIGSITGMVLAHTVLAVPYVLVVMTTAFAGLDERLEQASMSLGAGRLRTFFGVTLPLVRPAVITSMLFAFIASFDELITAMFICGVRAITLPKQMWDGIRDEIDPVIAAVAVLLILLSTLLLLISLFVKKRRGIGVK